MKVLYVDIAGTALYWGRRTSARSAGVDWRGTARCIAAPAALNARSMPNGMARAMDATRLPVPSAPSATLGA